MGKEVRSGFGSRLGAVLAAAGSAVGLGNIWRFPTELGANGGAAFLMVYILAVLLVGMPIMLCEFAIGRHTKSNTIGAFRQLSPRKFWRIAGIEGVFVAFLILSYYIVVGGWTLRYAVQSIAGNFGGGQDYSASYAQFVAQGWAPGLFAIGFLAMVHVTIICGVKRGIERFSKIMMPVLLLIICVLVCGSFSMVGFKEGMLFLLKPDFKVLRPGVVLSALGQAFYSLSLAMGCLCTYASYFSDRTSLVKTAASVVSIDTVVAILAAMIIFPAVFSMHVGTDAGPGLVFITLPHIFDNAFAHVPLVRWLFSGLFYVLLLVAALTSAISLHEPVTAYVSEEWGVSRQRAAWMVTGGVTFLGLLCALSMGPWGFMRIGGMSVFDLFDFVSAKVLIPLGGLVITLFAGWVLPKAVLIGELTNGRKRQVKVLGVILFLIRWVAPIAITVIFLNELFGG